MRTTTFVRRLLAAWIAVVSLAGVTWANAYMPAPDNGLGLELPVVDQAIGTAVDALAAQPAVAADGGAAAPDLSKLPVMPQGQFLVGASANSIAPDPAKWQTEGCSELLSNFPAEIGDALQMLAEGQLPNIPHSPNCVYLGGYGIGPARAATSVDEHAGVNVRSIAISNGTQTFVWQVLDLVGFFSVYRADICDGCGILGIREKISAATNIPVDHMAIGATHTHGGADGYGAWGGVPGWYREQLVKTVVASAYDALRAMRPASITIGSVDAPAFSSERRDLYYSSNDFAAQWMQATALPTAVSSDTPVIATLVNYGAHPVVLGSQRVFHGDWPATAAKGLGDQFGGVGLIFEAGLGNVSPSNPTNTQSDRTGDGNVDDYDEVIDMGEGFAKFVADGIHDGGHQLARNEMWAMEAKVSHPATNLLEVPGGVAGIFDRDFLPGSDGARIGTPYRWTKTGGTDPDVVRACTTAGPINVLTSVSGFRLGELSVITAPGELFGSMVNVVRSKGARRFQMQGGQTMVFGQTQDSLGYIMQSYEVDPLGGLTSNANLGEYEEEFMLDKCFGDHILDTQLAVLGRLQAQ